MKQNNSEFAQIKLKKVAAQEIFEPQKIIRYPTRNIYQQHEEEDGGHFPFLLGASTCLLPSRSVVLLDVLALPVNFVQDSAISESHQDDRNPSEGDGAEFIVNDKLLLRFFRVVFFDVFAQIIPEKLDE